MKDYINTLIKNFSSRNITAKYFNNLDEVRNEILQIIEKDATIGIGNSQTLKDIGISIALANRGNTVYDKTMAKSKEESKVLKKKSLLTDWYITGTNALSLEGHIVNIDHSGNRVAAMTYGPDKVIIVVGKNKIEKTLQKAINRVRNHSARLNAIRAGYNPPCVKLKKCVECKTKERVCFNFSIIEGQFDPKRMMVFIVDKVIGF